MAGSNPENVEQDEAASSDQIECKEDQEGYNNEQPDSPEGELKDPSIEREDEGRESPGPASPEHVGETPSSSSMLNQSPSTPGPSTPAGPTTPGQDSNATTPGSVTTPGSQQVPIQPYAYPPYYYPPVPGYAPHPATMPHGAHAALSADHLMTCATNPYQYTDVSNLSDPIPDTRRNRGGVTEPFPEKLHRMLEGTEREGTSDVVSFFSHGRAFAIHKPRRFVQEIMPRFFRQTRLTSFQRQLNLYGFRRISQGPDNGGYYHELFLKGRLGLCVNMKRTKVKGDAKLKRDPDSEPNFYAYPPIQPETSAVQNHQLSSPASASSPGRPSTTPLGTMYPGYAYPPPPHYPYPPVPNAPPYTAAQQPNAPVYPPYPPYYAYPWYPPPPPPGHMIHSPHQMTPQTSPIKTEGGPKTPDREGSPSHSGCDTPASIDSALGNTPASVRAV